jgi:hypothetical protein
MASGGAGGVGEEELSRTGVDHVGEKHHERATPLPHGEH